MKLILSTVGTSLLTNQVSGSQRQELFDAANMKESECSSTLIDLISYIKKSINIKLVKATVAELRKLSAELNGILGVYNGEIPTNPNDTHVLVASDTYQGKITAEIIESFLKEKGFTNIIIISPSQMSTKDKTSFVNGTKNLLKWFDKELDIENYRLNKYEVIFNLTGGFKSLQGYLNTFGMFYADRIVYIFESSNQLIEIPRLPIEIPEQMFEDKATDFLLMSCDYPCKAEGISHLMLEEYDEDTFYLSEWGMLSWNKVKRKILEKKLIKLPNISYESSFIKDFDNATPLDRINLQEILAQVSSILLTNQDGVASLKAHGGIQYDNYSGKNKHLGHFRLNQGDRVSCTAIGNNLSLRRFGRHDDLNNNP
jgi:putative CRISPR-associated protein (TIGR02619 family)